MEAVSEDTPIEAPVARISHEYTRRLVVLSLVLLGFGVACVYDGVWRYPEHNRRYAKYEGFVSRRDADRGWKKEWAAYARSQGWDVEPPDHHSALDIRMQFVTAVLCLPLGIGSVVLFALNRRRRFSAKDDGLHGWRGTVIPYEAISQIDKALWDSKGIAVAWATVKGARRRVALDDWKWVGMEAILDEVERRRVGAVEPHEESDSAAEV